MRYNRLVAKQNTAQKLLGKQRVKRELANSVGDILKTLFGTLSNSDLTEINNEFDKIYKDDKAVASTLSNHAIILKKVLDSSLTKHGIPHPQILTQLDMKRTIQEFEQVHRTRYHFDNAKGNYQHLLVISEITVVVIKILFLMQCKYQY